MGKQVTEMLKGTLEGIVLAILSGRPAYGYEITAWLREQGFSDIAEGTVYALLIRIEQRGLVDVEKVPSEKGPPRKVYSLNAQGQRVPRRILEDLELPRRTDRTAPRRRQMTMSDAEQAASSPRWSATSAGGGQYKARVRQLPPNYRTAVDAMERYLMHFGPVDGDSAASLFEDLSPTCSSRAAADGTPIREIVGEDPVEFVDALVRNYSKGRVCRPGAEAAGRHHRSRCRRGHLKRGTRLRGPGCWRPGPLLDPGGGAGLSSFVDTSLRDAL